MTENMKKYLELVSKDEQLQKKIAKAEAEYKANLVKEAIKLAGEYGITLTEADFVTETPAGELSDDELDAVAGGAACACVGGGGGPGYDDDAGHFLPTCACVLGGIGQHAEDSGTRCACPFVGGGTAN